MKKIASLFLAMMLVITMSATAFASPILSACVANADGAIIGYDITSGKEVDIPSQVYQTELGRYVEISSIGDNAFFGMDITDVTMPSDIETIGARIIFNNLRIEL